MGIWIETGVFLLVLAFGLWQIQDVKKERRKRNQAPKPQPVPDNEDPQTKSSSG